jgi:uncharacterized protein (DUF4213/DUF364 family)
MLEECDIILMAKRKFISEIEKWNREHNYHIDLEDEVVISRPLSPKEAIGEPERSDFPLLRRKEALMQAIYRGAVGQAFTSDSGNFKGTLKDVLDLPLTESFECAVLISTMNAVLRSLDRIERTVHCKNEGPKRCADCLAKWAGEHHLSNVGLVGLQPALLEALVKVFGSERVMVTDLAEAGSVIHGVDVLDGMDSSKLFEHCNLILITGSTIVNGTIDELIEKAKFHDRKVVFFGTTIAGAAYLLSLERWCPCST